MTQNAMPVERKRWTPGVKLAIAFAAAYTLAAAVGALRTGNSEFIFYIVVMLVLAAAVSLVHWRVGLSTGVLWALAVWGGLHMAGGLVPVPASWPISGDIRVLYSWWIIPAANGGGLPGTPGGWLKYDQVVHAFGFGVTTWVCWQALRGATGAWAKLKPTFGLMVLCAAAGLGFGALNEVVEFAATLMMNTNVGGYENTGWDLVFNSLGAITAAVIIYTGSEK